MLGWTENVPIRERDRCILDQNEWLGDLSIQIVAAEKSDCRMTIANLMGKLKGANESLTLDCWSMPFHSPKAIRGVEHPMKDIYRLERKWAIETIYRRLRTNLFHSPFSHHFNRVEEIDADLKLSASNPGCIRRYLYWPMCENEISWTDLYAQWADAMNKLRSRQRAHRIRINSNGK